MSDDRALLRHLRGMWESADPPPRDLAERVRFSLELDDLDFDLLRMSVSGRVAGARAGRRSTTVTFTGELLEVLITVVREHPGGAQIDGWLSPPAASRVVLRSLDGVREVRADEHGRFSFLDAPTGLCQLVFHPVEGRTLDHPAATPAITL